MRGRDRLRLGRDLFRIYGIGVYHMKITTAGESHGKGLCAILEGIPAGVGIDLAAIDRALARRQSGYGRGARQAIECDRVEILSGVRGGKTLGSPIALYLPNRDHEALFGR